MLTVTNAAGAHLARILDRKDAPAEIANRFIYEEEGIALRQDRKRDGDETFKHEGRTVLLLDSNVSELLTADTLDLKNAKLTLIPPKDTESPGQ